jgi:hypothetical protein
VYAWFRRLIAFGFVAGVFVAGFAAWFAYCRWTDPVIVRGVVLDHAKRVWPTAQFELERVDIRPLGGARLVNLAVRTTNSNEPLIRIPSARIFPDRNRLLEGELQLHKLVLDNPEFRVSWMSNPDAFVQFVNWLAKNRVTLTRSIRMEIRNGSLAAVDPRGSLTRIEFASIDAELDAHPSGNVIFRATSQFGKNQSLRVSGRIDLQSNTLYVDTLVGADLDVALLAKCVPPMWREVLAEVSQLSGRIDVKADGWVCCDEQGLRGDGTLIGNLRKGGMAHPRFPYPVTDAAANFTASSKGIDVSNLTFRLGPIKGVWDVSIPGWSANALVARGTLHGVPFVQSVYRLLPPGAQRTWDSCSPEGAFHVSGRISRTLTGWSMDGDLVLDDATITYRLFPYRVHHASGRIVLHPDGHQSINIDGLAGDRPVSLTGTVTDFSNTSGVDLKLRGTQIPIDDVLRRALDAPAARTAQNFVGPGRFDFAANITRKQGQPKGIVQIEADVAYPTLFWRPFPYPLTDVSGRLSIGPTGTMFRQFLGKSGSTTVRVDGRVVRTTDGSHVEVFLTGHQVALDDRLRRAMPPDKGDWIDVLQAQGAVDFTGEASQGPGDPLHLWLRVDPRAVSISPTCFPYRLQNLSGIVEYRDGTTTWNRLRFSHGAVQGVCSGAVGRHNSGEGWFQLRDLSSQSLPVDADLLRALPPDLREVAEFLAPNQPIDLSLRSLEARWPKTVTNKSTFSFDGSVRFRETDMIPRIGMKRATGTLSLAGSCGPDHRRARGQVTLERGAIAGFTATNASSSVELAGEQFWFPQIKGNFYGGKISGYLQGRTGRSAGYECALAAHQARLGRFVRERMRQPPDVDADVDAELHLKATTPQLSAPVGAGRIEMRRANIVRLPILWDLLDVLHFQVPDGQLFDQARTQFRIGEKALLVDQLELTSPTLSLFATEHAGRIDLTTSAMDIRLGARWLARGRLHIPGISDVINTASDQVFTVHIHGTLSEPIITTEPGSMLRRLIEGPRRSPPAGAP